MLKNTLYSFLVFLFFQCSLKTVQAAPSHGRPSAEKDDQLKDVQFWRRKHDMSRFGHLRDRVDRINLRQLTDRNRLEYLENAVELLSKQKQDQQALIDLQKRYLEEQNLKLMDLVEKISHMGITEDLQLTNRRLVFSSECIYNNISFFS